MAYSLTYRNGQETIVQFIPEPDSAARGMIGTGRTVCAPSDVYDPAVGERIAFGRALAELGAQIEAQGLAEVKSYADFVKDIARNYVDNVNAEPVEETPPTWDPADNPEPSVQEEEPDEPAEPHVPEGIEKWVREHGYRLEVSAER